MRRYGALLAIMLGAATCNPDPGFTELDCSDGIDNDNDFALDCRDTDCSDASECLEVCNGGVDEDLDNFTDCADSDCIGSPLCGVPVCGDNIVNGQEECDLSDLNGQNCVTLNQGFGSGTLACIPRNQLGECTFDTAGCFDVEVCTGGVDEDTDGLVDCGDPDCDQDSACATVACTPFPNDSCTGNQICIANTCEPAFDRPYTFSGFAVALGPLDPTGADWDGFGAGGPDPRVDLFINGVLVLQTSEASNSFSANYSETVTQIIDSNTTLDPRVFEIDVSFDDLALSCTIVPVTAALLRGRSVQCQNGNFAQLDFSITPN